MSDDDWENEDRDIKPVAPAVAVKSKWDDEDVEDVKDSWDASDDEAKPAATPAPTSPAKSATSSAASSTAAAAAAKSSKKKALAQKLAARKEEEERAKREAIERLEAEARAKREASETPEQRKARLARSVMESDFENAKALFGDLAVSGGIPKPEGAIELQEPKSRGEFDDFVKLVMKKFSTFEKMPQYTYFVESLVRELALPLSVDDTRKVTTSLNAMINEKQKALKDNKGKKKGAAKQSLKTEPSDSRDTTNYDDYNDDFDDFM